MRKKCLGVPRHSLLVDTGRVEFCFQIAASTEITVLSGLRASLVRTVLRTFHSPVF